MISWRRLLLILTLISGFSSCSTSSNASEDLHSDTVLDSSIYLSPEATVYASSISNLISTFPKFHNDSIDREIGHLKIALNNYLTYARKYDITNKQIALAKVEQTYKKIQKLRKFLGQEDNEVLNRYLVRIKTNVNLLESSLIHNK